MSAKSNTKKLKVELYSNILTLVVRLAGESVKDKFARAVIIGVVAMVGYYFEVPVDMEAPAQVAEPVITQPLVGPEPVIPPQVLVEPEPVK